MNRPSNNEEDESRLLAALGSTATSALFYEQSVLRDAKLCSAPQILLPNSIIATGIANNSIHSLSSLVPCGEDKPALPDLSSLDFSMATKKKKGAPGMPYVLKILSRTRALLQSTLSESRAGAVGKDEKRRQREIDLLRMKEHILLGYLTDVGGLEEDDAVIPQSEAGYGRKRPRTHSAGAYYGNALHNDENVHSGELVLKERAVKYFSYIPNGKKGTEDRDSSISCLDRIKKGDHLLDLTRKRSLKRNAIMKMKSQMRIESGMAPLKTMEDERFDAEKSRKRREERRRRRLTRQRDALGIFSSREEETAFSVKRQKASGTSKKSKDELENIIGKKSEKDNRTLPKDVDQSTKRSGVRWQSTDGANHAKVFCPICQVILKSDDQVENGSPDEYLAKHIAECQEISRTCTGYRTLRKRKKPAINDLDNNEADDTEDQIDASVPGKSEVDNVELQVGYGDTPASNKTSPASIDDMDEFDYEERVDNWILRGLEEMGEMVEQDPSENPPGAVVYEGGLEIPAWVNNRLFPYQRTGVRWMWELHCQGAGGVVGDEMGLGKTVQVSSFLGAMAMNRLIDSVLFIAPATMLVHWLSELAVWAPGLRRIMVHRSGESGGVSRAVSRGMLRSLQKWLKNSRSDRVNEPMDEDDYNDSQKHSFCGTGYAVVTTYESIRRSSYEWTNHNWSYVVLDEGQKIRNPDADVTLACKRLRTPHRLLLSGTPIQNDLRELWSLFDFIFPGRLGTLPTFEAEFAEPIKRGGYSNASPMQVQLAYRCALVLKDLINPYLLRRQKKDLKEVNRMPGKTEQVLFCRLSSRQRLLYEEYLRSDEVMGVMRGSVQLLKAVTVLRKLCNHPDLVTGSIGDSVVNDASSSSSDDENLFDQKKLADWSGKLQVLSKILPLWHMQGHKVIIFTQWRKMLSIIERLIKWKEWKYVRLDGNTNIASRQKLVDMFNNDESYFCMLMTTRTGGVGLNITGANRVLLYDPDWNPQTDAQARERAWRFGQKRDVTVYRLITVGSIEEKIYQRQIFKTALTNQILQDPRQRRLFSQRDLKDLFTLKAETNDVTETVEITKGRGVVEMDLFSDKINETENDKQQAVGNTNTLETVMKSRGLCAIFDHDFVEKSSVKKPISVVEMEANAKRVAIKAASALKESTENQNRFEPTWTGSDGNHHFGGECSVRGTTGKMASSSSLLTNLKNKRMQIASSDKGVSSRGDVGASTKKNSGLLLRIRRYIRLMASNGKGPTTRDLLSEFKDVPDSDAAIFRRMLKHIAFTENGRWVEKR